MVIYLPLAAALILAVLALIFRCSPVLYSTGRNISIVAIAISAPMTLIWFYLSGMSIIPIPWNIVCCAPVTLSVIAILLFLRKRPAAHRGFDVLRDSKSLRH